MIVKIRFQFQILLAIAIISFSTNNLIYAQDTIVNKYGLWVIKNVKELNNTIKTDSNKKMMDINKLIPNLVCNLRYASLDNFMHKKLYPRLSTTYLRLPAAKALQRIQYELNKNGMGLKIFDAYRPYSITEKMWEPIKDDRYVADPKNGSGHNRGIAIDLTLINLKTNEELPMGTDFDNFSDSAHQTFTALPKNIMENRKILRSIMENNGFKALETEWWHYSLPNSKYFELLDISFEKLKRMNK